MALHPKIAEQLILEAKDFPDLTRVSVAEGRRVIHEMVAGTDAAAGEIPSNLEVKDHYVVLPDRRIRVRAYTPRNAARPSPVLVYFHGGGWVYCDLDTHDSACREIATRSHQVVVAVDYRRSPEHKFPAALEDCYAATRWLSEPDVAARLDTEPTRISVGGDSAGGNMAAVLPRLTRDRDGPKLEAQVLICPVTAYYPDNLSYKENATGTGLESSFMPWMWQQYLDRPEDGNNPLVAPLLEPDLSKFPRALIITAEYDILRDEGLEYARRLREASVPVRSTCYPGMVHSFIDYRGIAKEGWQALDEIAEFLRQSTPVQGLRVP